MRKKSGLTLVEQAIVFVPDISVPEYAVNQPVFKKHQKTSLST